MKPLGQFDRLTILGVDIDVVPTAAAIEYIIASCAPGETAGYVIKPYVEFLVRADRDESVRELLGGADLSIADSIAVMWAAHYLYAGPQSIRRFWLTLAQIVFAPDRLNWPLADRAAGINFTWPLLEAAAAAGRRVYLVGQPAGGNISTTATVIAEQLPSLTIAGTHAGRDESRPAGDVSNEWLVGLAADIKATAADLILVGMGFPLQEQVCAYLAGHLDHGVFIGEGGSFDYQRFGGQRAKAPVWLQRIGLEWLWRLVLEPRRWRRQLAIPRFIWRVWRSRT